MPSAANPKPGELARYVAAEVREELKRQEVSFAKLSRAMGMGETYVSDRLSEKRARYALDLNDLMQVEKVLRVSPVDFIQRATAQRNADALKALEDQAVARVEETRANDEGLHPKG